MCLRSFVAVLAPSRAESELLEERMEFWDASWTSRPVVKALKPAPERIMARVEEEVERWEKREGISFHILLTVNAGDTQFRMVGFKHALL